MQHHSDQHLHSHHLVPQDVGKVLGQRLGGDSGEVAVGAITQFANHIHFAALALDRQNIDLGCPLGCDLTKSLIEEQVLRSA